MAFSNTYTFGFAASICFVCSLALATVSTALRDIQEDNKRRDVQSSILGALDIPEDGGRVYGEEIDKLWAERIELRVIDPAGKAVSDKDLNADGTTDQFDVDVARSDAKGTEKTPEILSVYVRKDGEKDGAYAIPVYGIGLWGPISGFIAIDPSGKKIGGATFFAPKETPGLGSEITVDKFEDQWKNKLVVGKDGNAQTVRVVKGAAAVLCPGDVEHCVDGISGATITSRGVDIMVEEALEFYDPYLTMIRGG